MKKTLNLISAVCSAVMLISLAGCNINSVPRQYKKLPDSLSEEDVLLTVGIIKISNDIEYRDKT